jgi:hypothetical protein
MKSARFGMEQLPSRWVHDQRRASLIATLFSVRFQQRIHSILRFMAHKPV